MISAALATAPVALVAPVLAAAAVAPVAPMLGLTQLSYYLTLKGSFSAVSKPNFAIKYAFESSRRDLHKALLCTVLKAQISV